MAGKLLELRPGQWPTVAQGNVSSDSHRQLIALFFLACGVLVSRCIDLRLDSYSPRSSKFDT